MITRTYFCCYVSADFKHVESFTFHTKSWQKKDAAIIHRTAFDTIATKLYKEPFIVVALNLL